MGYKNIEDRRACQKRWYNNHKQQRIQEVSQRRDELLDWLNEYKSDKKCEICGESHPACLDFHHINPEEKETGVMLMAHNGASKKKIMKEIDKCKIICANCHRKLHYVEKV